MGLKLDHIAVAATSLEDGCAWVTAHLGVNLQPGGAHPRYGTQNMLLGLEDGTYLEVIAKAPDMQSDAGHSWFGLDDFSGPPRLVNWICQSDDLTADLQKAPQSAGQPQALTRGDLSWQIAVPDDGTLPFKGAFPTIMQWAQGVVHPSRQLPDSGCKLTRLDVFHPEANMLRNMIALDDPRVHLSPGAFGLRATIDTPHGSRVLA